MPPPSGFGLIKAIKFGKEAKSNYSDTIKTMKNLQP